MWSEIRLHNSIIDYRHSYGHHCYTLHLVHMQCMHNTASTALAALLHKSASLTLGACARVTVVILYMCLSVTTLAAIYMYLVYSLKTRCH